MRPLERRAGEGVVDHHGDVAAVRDLARRREIGQPHHRVGRRLEQQEARRRLDRRRDRVHVARVHVARRDALPRQDLLEQAIGAAVGVVADDGVVADLEERGHGADGRHARGEGVAGRAALERGDVGLERGARRVLGAGVFVALVLAQRLLHVGRRLVDRRDDRACRRVGLLAGVDADRGEAGVGRELHASDCTSRRQKDAAGVRRATAKLVKSRRPTRVVGHPCPPDAKRRRRRAGGCRRRFPCFARPRPMRPSPG